jgi:hypothetical protein
MLGLDGAGMLLSLHQGALYRSVPDRLDFKRPMQFDGHDMPPECTLVAPSVLHAAMSPGRRFLWVELAGPRARERCLVDMETRTVTHEAGQRLAPPEASEAVGWLSSSELALAEQAPPHPGAWHVVDVTTRRTVRVAPPGGTHVLRLDAVGGAIHRAALAWDATAATWRVETQAWRDNQGFEPGASLTLRGLVPPRGAMPGGAALAPDKRALLVSWAPRGGTSSLLTLTSLQGGDTVAVPLPGVLEAAAPLFWGPEQVPPGHYRFFTTMRTPRGPEPVAVEAAEASP